MSRNGINCPDETLKFQSFMRVCGRNSYSVIVLLKIIQLYLKVYVAFIIFKC